MPASMVGSVAAPIVGGLLGQLFSQGDKDKASANQAAALAAIQGLKPPTADELKVALQQYKVTGQISPALQQVISQGPSQMNSIKTNPALMQAQMSALSKLQQQGNGGLQPQDLAALAQVQQLAAGQGQSQQASALQAMQQRGMGGSGNELAARLSAAQGSANTANQGGLNIQGQAAQRALQAIMQSGQLGGQIQGQQFGESAQKAQAQDLINRFNAANTQNVQGQNVGAQNQAQYYNVGNAQNVANMNTGVGNQQALYNSAMQQQAYNNQAQKAGMASGALNTAANQSLTNAGQTQQMFSGMGNAVGTGIQGYAANQSKNQSSPATNYTTMPDDYTEQNYKVPDFGAQSNSSYNLGQ